MFGRNPYSSTPFSSGPDGPEDEAFRDFRFVDRITETTTTTGTGNITLLGPVVGFDSFVGAFSLNIRFAYVIDGQTGTEWETGEGYLSAPSTLVRSIVHSSSNSGALVNFSSGTKNVFCAHSSYFINNAPTIGKIVASLAGGDMQ